MHPSMPLPRLAPFLASLLVLAACSSGPTSAEAEQVVRRYNALVIDAYRTGDYRIAEPIVGQDELRKLVGHIGAKTDQGLTLDAQLLDITIQGVERGGEATLVSTEERWKYVNRRMGSGEPAGPESTDRYRMKYHLKKVGKIWVVDQIEFTEKPEVGQPVPEPQVDVRTMHGLPAKGEAELGGAR
jgi:hypothetical protein